MSESCSVIVTTRNSAGTLARVLDSAKKQTVEPEIVVVDNFSTDSTRRVCAEFSVRVITAGDERANQRNVGALMASGEWLLFVDADMVMSEDLIQSCLSECVTSDAQAIVIPQLAEGEGFLAKARSFEKTCYMNDDVLEAPRFFHRSLFQVIGGYDPKLIAGEDWDIAEKVRLSGARVARCSGKLVHLDGRIRLREVFQKMNYYSPSLMVYRAKHPDLAARQMSLMRPALLRHWTQMVRRPALFGGIAALKAAELAGLLFGVCRVRLHDCFVRSHSGR